MVMKVQEQSAWGKKNYTFTGPNNYDELELESLFLQTKRPTKSEKFIKYGTFLPVSKELLNV